MTAYKNKIILWRSANKTYVELYENGTLNNADSLAGGKFQYQRIQFKIKEPYYKNLNLKEG